MKTSLAEKKARTVRPGSLTSKTDAVSKARLFLNAEATRQQAVSMWLAVEPELRTEAAIELWRAEELTLERAAEIAGLNRWVFHDMLLRRGLKINIDTAPVAELNEAVASLRKRS